MQNLKPRKTLPFRLQILFLTVLATETFAAGGQLPASQSSTPPKTSTAVHKSVHRHKPPSAAPTSLAAPAPVIPAAPRPPDWPANEHPSEATVLWNSQGLRIEASNSSLRQILKDVATATGAKVVGLGSDDRIFGSYGPGPARDVLAQLLDGSGYNVLMIGDQGQGTPREIVLSAQPKGGAPPAVNSQAASNDENADADDQSQQPPQLQAPPTIRNGFAPGAPPRTPQQIMQEMQQRQQQQLQQGNSPQ
jgi:hypothetical protein